MLPIMPNRVLVPLLLLIADGYQIADGVCSVPDAPGFGLTIDESRFERARVNFELRA